MKQAVSHELYAYWSRLRAGRAAPEREDIDPAAIRSVLADTFVGEVVGGPCAWERDLVMRLSGTRLNAFFLDELRGQSLREVWRDEDRRVFSEVVSIVLDDCTAMVAAVQAAPADHRPLDLELLLLPLRHHGKTHARVLGSLTPVNVPTWLGLLPVQSLSLVSFRGVRPSPAPPLAEPAIATPEKRPARHGRFLVYQGGR